MIHHYINLVCWRSMLKIFDPSRDVVWVDTVSLHLLVRRIRRDAEYRPGTSVLRHGGPAAPEGGGWFFLTPCHLPGLPGEMQYELPVFADITVPDDLAAGLAKLPPGTRVGIGISAPKQNHLAVALHAQRPDLEYHCLGAAVARYDPSVRESGQKLTLSGSGLEWLRFLITSPRRTWGKIVTTLREGAAALFHGPTRDAFASFAAICTPTTAWAGAPASKAF